MSTPDSQNFLFVTCQAGAEKALKSEIASLRPEFRFAYSRPGFVTFKLPEKVLPDAVMTLDSVFARAYGMMLGRAQGEDCHSRVNSVKELKKRVSEARHLHFWRRDESGIPDETFTTFAAELKASFPDLIPNALPSPGEVVLDVILVSEQEWWVGYHVHGAGHRPWVGGIYERPLPPEVPSRAYLKLSEALEWLRPELRGGQRVVELGSAPGGASLVLLERGAQVIGVDPADMDERILADPRFTHLRLQATQVRADEIGAFEWLVSDMNVTPEETLRITQKFVSRQQTGLLGVILTLKFNGWALADKIPEYVSTLQRMGLHDVRVAHLYGNRQEVCATGLIE